MYKEKGYYELLVLISILFVHFLYIIDNVKIVLGLVWNLSDGIFCHKPCQDHKYDHNVGVKGQ